MTCIGQREILNDALQYIGRKRSDAIDLAKESGVEIIMEDK